MTFVCDNRIGRRAFLAMLGAGAAAGFAGAAEAPRRPNIVLVLADDLSPFELGCYGQRKIRTPNLDRLAAEGMRFTACYSACPVCAPSRCGLLTGLHMGHAQIRDNWERSHYDPKGGEGQWPLQAGTDTLPGRLRAAGYRTGCFGKWGLGGPDTPGRPLAQGFDRFFGYNCQRHAHQYWPTYLWDDDRRVTLDNPSFPAHQRLPRGAAPDDPASYARFRGRTYAPDRIIAEAERFIAEADPARPLFLFYATPLPHVGLQPPEAEVDAYDFPEKPYLGQAGYLPQRRPRAAYAAMVSRVDAEVGRLVAALRAAGRLDDTLILFAFVLYSGFGCHGRQCGLADYYRQIHLFFLKGEAGSELDNSVQQRKIYDETPWKGNFLWKVFLKSYVNYTRTQERQTPNFQRLIARLRAKYGSTNKIPQSFRDRFRENSLPLMKWTNILTFNTRAIVLYLVCLMDLPWLYFAFEIIVMGILCQYMRWRHERFCAKLCATV